MNTHWTVYLSGEIHTDWRERVIEGAKTAGLDITFTSPVTDHARSDDIGVEILGAVPSSELCIIPHSKHGIFYSHAAFASAQLRDFLARQSA